MPGCERRPPVRATAADADHGQGGERVRQALRRRENGLDAAIAVRALYARWPVLARHVARRPERGRTQPVAGERARSDSLAAAE